MSIRIVPDIEDLAESYVDVSERWTRNEFKALLDADGEDTLSTLRRKLDGCHLQLEDGSFCDEPGQITDSLLDRMDLRLIGFIGAAPLKACSHLRSLGFRSALPSSVGTAQTVKNGAA